MAVSFTHELLFLEYSLYCVMPHRKKSHSSFYTAWPSNKVDSFT